MSMDISRPHVLKNEFAIFSSWLRMEIHHDDGVTKFGSFHSPVNGIPGWRLEVSCLNPNYISRILANHASGGLGVHFIDIICHLVAIQPGSHDVQECQHAGF